MIRFSKGTDKRGKLGIVNIFQVPTLNSIRAYLGYKNIDCKITRAGLCLSNKKSVAN